MSKLTTALFGTLLLLLFATLAIADGVFEDVPLPASFMPGLIQPNFDGSVLGGGWGVPFVYTQEGGLVYPEVGIYAGFDPYAKLSGDGQTLAVNVLHAGGNVKQAAIWTAADGITLIPGVANSDTCSNSINSLYSLNYDGTIGTGLAYEQGCDFSAFEWMMGGESVLLANAGGGARGNDISADGSVIGGWSYIDNQSARYAAIWSPTSAEPIMILPDTQSEIYAVSADGTKACGSMLGGALYWDENVGAINLGALPGDEQFGATAFDISNDGKIVGQSGSPFFGTPRAFIWTPEDGMMYLADYLDAQGVVGHEGLPLFTATGISDDGSTITGAYTAGFPKQAFVVHLTGTVDIDDDFVIEEDDETPGVLKTSLMGARPNPFNPMTRAKFSLAREQHVRLFVYDMNGHRIAELANEVFGAGEHSVVWQGRDFSGRAVSSGNYLLRMETEDGVRSSKMMLVR